MSGSWVEAICDADFRGMLVNLDSTNVVMMRMTTLEEVINYNEAQQ